jgi:hypothetical protein
MRKPLLAVAALASALALAACGSSGGGLIPTEEAGSLNSDLTNIQAGVSAGDCAVTNAAIETATIDFESLPSSINQRLASQLQQGFRTLVTSAEQACLAASGNGSTGQTGPTGSSTTSSSSSSTTSSTTTTSTTTSSAATTTTSSSSAATTTTTPTNTGSTCTLVTTPNGGTVCEGTTGPTSSGGIGGGGGIGGPGN